MSSNRFVPDPLPENRVTTPTPARPPSVGPDYAGLVRFLIKPFLEAPDSLRVDCEISPKRRVWIRLAFDGSDKGRVFGRGGRNIQAIRTVLEAAAQAVGESTHLEIYGSQTSDQDGESDSKMAASKSQPRRSAPIKAAPKLRSHEDHN